MEEERKSGEGRELEERIDAALAARAGGEAAFERWLAEHPAHADEVRAHVARLSELGLLEEPPGPVVPPSGRIAGFQLVARLGEGGMGLVWVAEELALGRRVALKMIRPEQLWFEGARQRFRREVEAVGRLQHPGIVPVYAAGEEGGVPFFTMELVDGCTLADVLPFLRDREPARLTGADLARAIDAASRAVPGRPGSERGARGALFEGSWTDACLQIARQVAEALDHAHGRGLVHRDVKPSNVAITKSGRAMLLDFGLVRSGSADRVTRTSSQPGSLPYMSPEQVAGASDIDARTDVYSLGATLFELLTLRPAFDAPSASELLRRIAAGDVQRPRGIVPALASDVETVCLKALARAPAERYASADDFARDLGNLLARRPIEARRVGSFLRLLRWSQRHPKTSAALLAALPVALLALGAVAWVERARSAQILRLADVQRLADLEGEAAGLWPALPRHVPEYEGWLARADALAARLPVHRAERAALEGDGRSAAGAARFASDEERWQHATLTGLIAGLERLVDPGRGLVAEVRGRLTFARSVEERSVSGPPARVAWHEARSSAADPDGIYRGLALEPELGLLPIGADPGSGLLEFAHLASGEPARRDAGGRLALAPETGIVLVLLPGGRFHMGSALDPADPAFDPAAEQEEAPVHEVELAPFFMGKHPVTQAQWARMARVPAADDGSWAPLEPMVQISWVDCDRVLARCALILPTEAQWEYAARAGTRTPWWTGAEVRSIEGAANVLDLSVRRSGRASPSVVAEEWLDDGFVEIAPVDALAANGFGLHDVIGNVFEWCRDRYATYDRPVRAGDGERQQASTENRIERGGACVSLAVMARSAVRAAQPPTSSNWALGVRASRPLGAAAPR